MGRGKAISGGCLRNTPFKFSADANVFGYWRRGRCLAGRILTVRSPSATDYRR